MTRLGLVGGAGVWHARSFAGILNPKDEAAWAAAGFPGYTSRPVEGATVVAVCDDDLAAARALAGMVEGVSLVTSRPADLVGEVDGVLLCDDLSEQHQKRAPQFIEAGIPTFIDKPLSRDPREAEQLLELAVCAGTPVMSCSALRFSTELAALDKTSLGDVVCATAVGPNELVFYGIHPCELLQTILGPGVRSVRNVGDAERNHILLGYGDGRMGVLLVRTDIAYTFRATLLGTKGSAHLSIEDSGGFYREMLVQFIGMVRTKAMPIPPTDTLEIIRVLDAARRSRETGKEVRLGGE
jgi:predicted dehydrogenase